MISVIVILMLLIASHQYFRNQELKLFLNSQVAGDELVINKVIGFKGENYLGATIDNAVWDESVDFMSTKDSSWASDNYLTSLVTFGFSGIYIYDLDGHIFYAAIGSEAREIILPCNEIKSLFSKDKTIHTFMFADGDLLEIFGSAIVPSADIYYHTPEKGYMVTLKHWDLKYQDEIEDATGFNLTILTDAAKDKKVAKNDQEIIFYPLKGVNGTEIGMLKFHRPNQMLLDLDIFKKLSITGIFVLLVFILLFFYVTRKWMANPLKEIAHCLKDEQYQPNLQLLKNKDEFGEIARLIQQFNDQKKDLINEVRNRNEATEKYRALLAAQPDIMFLTDKAGFFIDYYAADKPLLYMMFGELSNRNLREIFPPDTADKFFKNFDKLLSTRTVQTLEFELQLNDGVHAFEARIATNDQNHLLSVIRDITDQKIMEQNLKESEDRFGLMVKNSSDIIILINPDGTLRYVNSSIHKITGYTSEEVLGKLIFEVIHPDDHEILGKAWDECLKHPDQVITVQYRHIHKTREWVYLEATGQSFVNEPSIASVIANVRDITGRKLAEARMNKMEEELRKNNSLLRSILESPQGIIIFSLDINCCYTAFTVSHQQTMKRLWNADIEIGMNMLDAISNNDVRDRARHNLDRTLQGEFLIMLEDYGDDPLLPNFYENRYSPIYNEQNTIIGLTVFVTDITERILAQKALQESETRYRSFISQVSDGVYRFELKKPMPLHLPVEEQIDFFYDNSYIAECNAAFMKMYAIKDHSDIIGKSQLELHGSRDVPSNRQTIRKFLEHGYRTENGITKEKDALGNTKYYSNNALGIIENNHLIRTWGTQTDITDTVKAQEALRIKDFAIQSSLSAIGLADMDGRIISANKAYVNLWGYLDEKDVLGRSFTEFSVSNEQALEIFSSLKNGESYSGIGEAVKSDGTGLHLQISANIVTSDHGDPICIMVSFVDITGRIAAEKEKQLALDALKDSETKYKTAFKTSPDSININKMDGTYVDINDGFTNIMGYSKEDVIGVKSTDIQIWAIPEDRDKLIEGLRKNGHVNNLESVFRAKDGSLKTALMSAQIIYINKEPHILNITRDFSQRKEMENELILAKEKAEESDKLKTSFLNNMSHEIRTPLNGILGFSNMLNNQGVDDNTRQHYLGIIQKNSDRLIAIIEAIINISTIESGQEVVSEIQTNIYEVLDNIYQEFKSRTNQSQIHLNYRTSLSLHDAHVMTDQSKLIQILTQLLDNAFKFTDSGTIEMGCSIKDDTLLFSVSDTGIGIKAEFHKVVFDRFRKINDNPKREYGGNGLGLAISKAYVELLGGKMWLESEPGKGSTFYFAIPFKPIFQGTKKQVEGDNPVPKNKTAKTLLIAEDEYSNYQLLEVILLRENYRVIHVLNGKEALETCLNNPDIDIVLMDLKMPVMDGLTATKLIKAEKPDLPIIAITAYALSGDKEKALEAGCDEYISKPIKKQDLLAVINRF